MDRSLGGEESRQWYRLLKLEGLHYRITYPEAFLFLPSEKRSCKVKEEEEGGGISSKVVPFFFLFSIIEVGFQETSFFGSFLNS